MVSQSKRISNIENEKPRDEIKHLRKYEGGNSEVMLKYKKLRDAYDEKYPPDDEERLLAFAKQIRGDRYEQMYPYTSPESVIPYDIYNCPDQPPLNYPKAFKALDVIGNWNPDDPTPDIKPKIFQGLCVFDYQTDLQKALNYRNAEKPFVMHNDPTVLETVERWNQPDYLTQLLGNKVTHRTESSHNNHFMYWKLHPGRNNDNWKPPTENIQMTFTEWLQKAQQLENNYDKDAHHWYFRFNSCKGRKCSSEHTDYLYDEVPFLKQDNSFYIVDDTETRGINCRFGMKGVIAENHFDSSRNMIAIFKGERRYMLAHPDQCPNMYLHERNHPSGRHSAVDWSDPDLELFPEFANLKVNEVVLQAGDVLYLPTFWFHYIISLGINYQCNGRSGATREYANAIHKCGF